MTYLQQRHLLLVKQWAELGHQAALRKRRLADTLDQWSAFSAKHAELTAWLQQAEKRLAETPTHAHIEDIIARMQHVSGLLVTVAHNDLCTTLDFKQKNLCAVDGEVII